MIPLRGQGFFISQKMKKFEYCEIPMKVNEPFIDQLNKGGQIGWRFITQAQKLDPFKKDICTGQPQITIMMIFEREIITDVENSEG